MNAIKETVGVDLSDYHPPPIKVIIFGPPASEPMKGWLGELKTELSKINAGWNWNVTIASDKPEIRLKEAAEADIMIAILEEENTHPNICVALGYRYGFRNKKFTCTIGIYDN